MPFDSPRQPPITVQSRPRVAPYQVDTTEHAFIAAVYRWMTLGLLVTAGVAWVFASSGMALEMVRDHRMVFYVLMFAELGLVFAISAMVGRLSAPAAGGLFLLYSALNGLTLSTLLLVYAGATVALAFGVTAATFGAMSVYGTVTRRDLTSWRSFLFMGLIGIVIASLVNMFLQSAMMDFIVSCAAVLVFTGLTAYDTQKLRAFARAGGATMAAAPISGALSLYLDFINLFLALLQLLGGGRRRQ